MNSLYTKTGLLRSLIENHLQVGIIGILEYFIELPV